MDPRAALLEWYLDAGVDEAIDASPVDHFRPLAEPEAAAVPAPVAAELPTMYRPAPEPSAPRLPLSLTESPAAAVAAARKTADQAKTLAELRQAVADFEHCSLRNTATKMVFADGNPTSGLMVIGEAPGAEEDQAGIPFCGQSGKLLDQMFRAIGFTREQFYITNTLFWRPPGNRAPTPEELAMCEPFVEKHIALVKPKLLVLVGGTAVKAILTEGTGITRMRGKAYRYKNIYLGEREIPVRVTFHPSYLLRQPAQKKAAWEDMQVIAHEFASL